SEDYARTVRSRCEARRREAGGSRRVTRISNAIRADLPRTYESAIVIDASIAPVLDEAQLSRMRLSGVTAVNHTVPSPFVRLTESLEGLAAAIEFIERHPDVLVLVRSVADITRAKAERKVGVILGPQNARPCE